MSYVTETEIAEELRSALSAYGEIKPGTPLYDLTASIGEVLSRLNNDLQDNKIEKSDLELSGIRSDVELLKKTKEEIVEQKKDDIAAKVADILWERLRKEREEDKSGFIDELRKL